MVTVLGNLFVILVISSDSHLHTPMYFFLSNLSFIDICFISTTILKMLVNIQAQNKDISYKECLTQKLDHFSDVHRGDPHAEPLHLKPEEQGCEGGPGKAPQPSSLVSMVFHWPRN
ncbi:olfactory receptor 7D4-like [Diceros bicornis minor]|uniref:olfactory receptor 7D4-like n=1 Tax=Diceros bicornis minor TaxID=77932 RepID=UPI0026ECA933|nr:olfactory receptor 7D4-like [Diceros bicornis minor]